MIWERVFLRKVVIRSGSYEDLDDADILVNAIGRSRKEGETRLDMFGDPWND